MPSSEEIDWKMDCCRLPSIPHDTDYGVQGYDKKFRSQVPRLWEEGDYRRGGGFALQVLLPSFFLRSSGFFSSIALLYFPFLPLSLLLLKFDLYCDSAMIY